VVQNWQDKVPDKWFGQDIAGFDISWADPTHRGLLNELVGLDATSIDNGIDGDYWQYRPYPVAMLGSVLKDVVYKYEVFNFLEVGCGIGTKLVMANKIFGLRAFGFDRNSEYISRAKATLLQYGCAFSDDVAVNVDDAMEFQYYKDFDCIFLNRPIWNWNLEVSLERMVQDVIEPGTILILGNSLTAKDLDWPVVGEAVALKAFCKPH